jgi:hypothetical protein
MKKKPRQGGAVTLPGSVGRANGISLAELLVFAISLGKGAGADVRARGAYL